MKALLLSLCFAALVLAGCTNASTVKVKGEMQNGVSIEHRP